jgi:hypothetical protein
MAAFRDTSLLTTVLTNGRISPFSGHPTVVNDGLTMILLRAAKPVDCDREA